ncbi:hypothetical protein NLI96_g8164 [Meripilus lineatus]|uniref:ENTH domain-containing protein n=1 Tax=Meripilus lineatus TaxID=2056292 RepID=A0AAD5V310_9APHY|nr:hypothetical protein NLI96_g8164 [Physisporinus lineatus]
MASSYDKLVKLACKPKAAPPKSKYLDPIIAATWSEDGSVHDVCKALAPRFREPNAIIVFKALIVLHTMIRNGATDNVLQYLTSSDVLRLRNISAGHWEGYNAPQNLQNYAVYLDTRIRAYRDLKHDAIRVQSETNRDLRNSQAIEEGRAAEQPEAKPQSHRKRFGGRKKEPTEETPPPTTSNTPQRSKTMAGRKLRVMTVEKGLLRETKIVQKMIDALVECRFYLDDLEDELNITALRMLVKDILILFQACNEGVINVLEHYFEMSKIDAKDALGIYRHFCKETERVVEYLGVAKKLQNLLTVPIPNLRHAPVSLVGSLEEYLNDPNFEQNRIEYKTNKEAADRNAKLGKGKPVIKQAESAPKPSTPPPVPSGSSAPAASASSTQTPQGNQAMVDFFTAIESEQPTIPSTTYFQQQATFNPFSQQQLAAGPTVQVQATGFPPQSINPFGIQPQQPQPFGSFLQPQPTSFLQPQATGVANPFRQSTLFPQATGMPAFGLGVGAQPQPVGPLGANPFPLSTQPTTNPFPLQAQQTNPFPLQQPSAPNPFPSPSSTNPFPLATSNPQTSAPATSQSFNFFSSTSTTSTSPFPTSVSAFASSTTQTVQPTAIAPHPTGMPVRPASAPLKAPPPSDLQPVKTHQTGSRNPFGVPVAPAPPVPKIPTLFDLMNNNTNGTPQSLQQIQPPQSSPTGLGSFNLNGTNSAATSSVSGTGVGMSNIASGFVFGNDKSSSPTRSNTMPLSGLSTGATTTSGSAFTSSSLFTPLSSQPTATSSINTNPSIGPSAGIQPLKPQLTGFAGLKAFKPSSSFGAALLESLPPIPQSAPTTPGVGATNGTASVLNGSGTGLPSTSNTVGVGLRPQMTGGGVANPFRASMFAGAGTGPGPSTVPAVPSLPASSSVPVLGGGVSSTSPFGSSFAGVSPGSGLPNNGTNNSFFGSGAAVGGANTFGGFGGGFGGNGQSGNTPGGTTSLI